MKMDSAGFFWTAWAGNLGSAAIRAGMPVEFECTMSDVIGRFWTFIRGIFAARRTPTSHRHLLGMYFGESNSGGRRKPNRDRA
jgi:hypothetical protein